MSSVRAVAGWARSLAVGAAAALGVAFVVAPAESRGLLGAVGLLDPLPAALADSSAIAYVDFVYGVLGAVMVGWMGLIVAVLRAPDAAWGWRMVWRSLLAWFVLDTAMSWLTGHPRNALLNAVTLLAIGIPHALLRPRGGSRP